MKLTDTLNNTLQSLENDKNKLNKILSKCEPRNKDKKDLSLRISYLDGSIDSIKYILLEIEKQSLNRKLRLHNEQLEMVEDDIKKISSQSLGILIDWGKK